VFPVTSKVLSEADLATWIADLVRAGTRVIAPVASGQAGRTEYGPIARLEEAALGGALPRRSLKEFFLPPSEVLLRYRQRKDRVEVEDVPTTFPAQVILGARPCDAAGVETLDAVMGWGQRDELWFGRREATTVVSLACDGVDSSCFCPAVGLGPDSTKGADVLLVPLERASRRRRATPLAAQLEGAVETFLQDSEPFHGAAADEVRQDAAGSPPHAGYLAHAVTPRGEELLRRRGRPWTATDRERAEAFTRAARERVKQELSIVPADGGDALTRRLDVELALAAADGGQLLDTRPSPLAAASRASAAPLPAWLARNFDHALWKTLALRCHGCGACAAVCSTCHCFDIVDEHDSYDRGARRRNWDSCQSAKFTLHASGHNPRQTQCERFRQRVMHKFSVYPRRFDQLLCTGCGRCARTCGAGMNLREILGELVRLADADTEGNAR
jgi:ferredoxin